MEADGAAVYRDNVSSRGSQRLGTIDVSGIHPRSYLFDIERVCSMLKAHREATRPVRISNNSLQRLDEDHARASNISCSLPDGEHEVESRGNHEVNQCSNDCFDIPFRSFLSILVRGSRRF